MRDKNKDIHKFEERHGSAKKRVLNSNHSKKNKDLILTYEKKCT